MKTALKTRILFSDGYLYGKYMVQIKKRVLFVFSRWVTLRDFYVLDSYDDEATLADANKFQAHVQRHASVCWD